MILTGCLRRRILTGALPINAYGENFKCRNNKSLLHSIYHIHRCKIIDLAGSSAQTDSFPEAVVERTADHTESARKAKQNECDTLGSDITVILLILHYISFDF